MQKFLKALCFSLMMILAASCVFADEILQPQTEPLSPEYLEWLKNHSDDADYGGYIPIPIDLSYLDDNPPIETNDSPFPILGDTAIPTKYDLRNVNGKSYVTSIKNQNPYGTCWAHAAIGAIESNMLMQGLGEADLSEMHLAWFTFKGSDKSKTFGTSQNSSLSNVLNNGGNAFYPTAMFSRLSGPAYDSDVPYPTQPSKNSPDDYTMAVRLREVEYLRMELNNETPFDINANKTERDNVKRRIMQHGSVMASYYNNDSNFKQTSSNGISYYNATKSTNHAIQIVGWDDSYSRSNFATNPNVDGAWLIKNSWGNINPVTQYVDSSYDGYFWMSYAQYLKDGAAFIVEKVNPNMKVYDYSPLGWCATWGWPTASLIHTANVFKAEGDNEKLIEVGFFTPNNNTAYEIKIYTGMSSMPSSTPIYGSPVSSMSGTMTYAGWHTVTLNTPVSLTKGQYFSVVVTYTNYSMTAVEANGGMASNATIEDGSFFSYDGTSWTTGKSKNYNATIKAFTVTGTSSGTAPSITTASLPDGQVSTAYSETLTATGTSSITWSVSSGTLPEGLTLNASTGVISGTPTTAGTYTFTIKATNSYGNDTKSYTLTITAGSSGGTVNITTDSMVDGYVGQYFSQTMTATSNPAALISWELLSGSLPPGLSLSRYGTISGTPTTAGTYSFTLKASSTYGNASKAYTMTVSTLGNAPRITTRELPYGLRGDSTYRGILTASSATAVTWSITSGSLPTGLSLNSSTGIITGTPSTIGTYIFTVKASNSYGSTSRSFTIYVYSTTLKLDIDTTQTLPDGTVGTAYYEALCAFAMSFVNWSISSGTLPPGLTLDAQSGVIAGTPTTAGTYTFTVKAANAQGNDTRSLTIKITGSSGTKPAITTSSLPDGKLDEAYSQTLSATGTTPITWSAANLPAGLSINASTGEISGTPTSAGTFTFTVTAQNDYGTASRSYTLNIIANITGDSVNISGYVGYAVRSQLSVTASGTVTWRASSSLPSGLSLSRAGLISGTPRTAGNFSVKITATAGTSVTEITVNFTINAKPEKPVIRTSSLPNAVVSEEYSSALTITGTAPLTVTATNLPDGLSFNAETWTISGTPQRAGTYSIRITAENIATQLENRPVTKTIRITIKAQIPVIVDPGNLADGIVGEAYNGVQFTTSKGTAPITWRISGQPSGMRMSTTGLFNGTPSRAGNFNMTVRASNAGGNDTLRVPIRILQKPEVSSARMSNGTTDVSYTARFTAKGTTPITWTITELPDSMSYSQNTLGTTATVTGIPTTPGIYSVKLSLSNEAGTKDYTVNFNVRGVSPRLTATLTRAIVGQSYRGSRIYATGTKPMEISYSISASDMAKFGITSLEDIGLSFKCNSADGTAEITGTPSISIRNLPITFTARNVVSSAARRVNFTASGTAPRFTEPTAATVNITCEVGSDIELDFTVTGSKNITYSMNSVSGFTLTQTGDFDAKLTGTAPARDTTTTLNIKAANPDGSATKRVIIKTQTPPKITTASLPAGTVNRNYSARVTATGTSTIRYTLTGTLPTGLRFSNGTFSGKPTQSGTFTVTVTAANSIGTDSKDFTITIN